MNKIIGYIKVFFEVLVKSITNLQFYKEIVKWKFSFSLKYLFFLFYLISLIEGIIFAGSISILVLPKLPSLINTFNQKAGSLYPTSLVVNIKKGDLSTNQKEPYYIDSLNQLGLSKGTDHFLTIDTNANPSEIRSENTQILITKDSFVFLDKNNSYQVYPIDTKTNLTVDAAFYKKLLSQILPYLKYIEPGIVVVLILSILIWPFVAGGLSLIIKLIYLLLFSAIFFVVVKLMKKDITFVKLYQLNLHGSTLPILLSFVVGSLGIRMPFLLPSAILFVFMVLVVNQIG